MAKICLVHLGHSALARESIAAIRRALFEQGHELLERERAAGGRGQVARFEAWVAAADVTLLVDPLRWWDAALPWVQALRRRVAQASPAVRDRIMVLRLVSGDPPSPGGPLAELECFALIPREWQALLERIEQLAEPGACAEDPAAAHASLPALDAEWHAPRALAALEGALRERRAAAGGVVWLRGSMGSGKSQLLAQWRARARAGAGGRGPSRAAWSGVDLQLRGRESSARAGAGRAPGRRARVARGRAHAPTPGR